MVSIALATYNGSKYLNKQLLSIINQTLLPEEIIVVDDCSRDNTVEIINEIKKTFPNIHLYLNSENLGVVKTFKKAISKCNCNIIALCDQDDIWEVNKLQLCVEGLKKNTSNNTVPSIVFTDLKMMDEQENLLGSTFWEVQGYQPSKINFERLLIGNIVTGCTIVMNESMKSEIVNMPDNTIMHDYWIAILALGIGNFIPLDCSPIKYRMHSNSVTVKSKISFLQRIKLFMNIFFDTQRTYLEGNILQAEQILKVYESRLSLENQRHLKKFVSLGNKNNISRKLHVFVTKYL